MKLLTKKQAAKLLNRSPAAVEKLIYRGHLPFEITVRGLRIQEEAVVNFKPAKRGNPDFGKDFGNGRGWRKSDDERLKRLYGKIRSVDLAEKMGKTLASIFARARRLGLQSKRVKKKS